MTGIQITTSRDPSARARRFGKALARFLSVPYVNRGKQGLGEDLTWIVVTEDNGNPAGLVKRPGEERLDFRISFEASPRVQKMARPVVTGPGDAERIARFFELDLERVPQLARIIRAEPGRLEFLDGDELVMELLI